MLHAVLSAVTEAAEENTEPGRPRAGTTSSVRRSASSSSSSSSGGTRCPRVQKLLDERAEAIEGNIAKADEAQRKAEAALEEYTAQLADARTEAGRIRESAREDGTRIVAEAKDRATGEAARVTASAQAQIEAERQSALVSLRSEVGILAIDLASGVIGESLSDDAKATAVVDRFLADLEASEAAAGGKK